MGKHIKPFHTTLNKLMEDAESQLKPFEVEYRRESEIKEDPKSAFREEIIDRNASVEEIRSKWNNILKASLEQYNKDLKVVEKAKATVSESYNRLMTQVKESVTEIEDIGERFENDMYELQEIILFFTKESEKLMKLTDSDLRELFNIMAAADADILNARIKYGIESGRLNLEKEYKTYGISRRKPETINPDGSIKVGQRFPSQYAKKDEFLEESEYVNESILSSISNFFKDIFSDIKRKIFGIDDSLDSLEMNIKKLKEFANRL